MASYVLLLLAVAGVLFIRPVTSEIKQDSIKDDTRRSILFGRFSSGHHGWVSVSVTGAKASSTLASPEPSQLGFFLLSDEALFAAIRHNLKLPPGPLANPELWSARCVLDSPYITPLFTFVELDEGHYNRTFPVTHPGEYSLFFVSCPPETKVTMEVQTHMYNTNPAERRHTVVPLRRHGLRPHQIVYNVFHLSQ